MPRTIYEKPKVAAHGDQAPGVPKKWAYIGATVQNYDGGAWVFSPVNNRDGATWAWLNAEVNKVDYVIRDITWHKASIDITDEDNAEFGIFRLIVKKVSDGTVVFDQNLPDDTDIYTLPNDTLVGETTYEFNLTTQRTDLSWTQPSLQTITTPKNPIPKPPVLSYSNATNQDITLTWTSPADSTAVKYRVYAGIGSTIWAVGNNGVDTQPTVNKKWKCISLAEDTKYFYQVAGINSSGYEGPKSNRVQVATGHEASYTAGYTEVLVNPATWGSYRGDIKWRHHKGGDNWRIQQGYWQADPRETGTTYDINRPQEEAGRYTGCIVYDIAGVRNANGHAAMDSLDVHRCEIIRLYRFRYEGAHWPPEPTAPNYMVWHLVSADIRNPGSSPNIYGSHRNNYDSPDAVSGQDRLNSGSYHNNLRLPRSFGKALVTGWYNGTWINGICLFRSDHQNSGSGAAGYGAWAGHGVYDTQKGYTGNSSDLRIRVTGNYRYQTRGYLAPYRW